MKKNITILSALFLSANSFALSLEEGLNIVFDENPQLQSFKNEVAVQEQAKNQNRANFMPQLTASYSLKDVHNNIEGSQSTDANPSTGALNLSQDLFVGGANIAGYKQAKYNTLAAEINYNNQQQEIFKTATDAYLSVITARQVLEFNERQVKTNQEEMKRVKQRFDLGDITLPDLKEFEARLSGYVADKEAAYGALLSAKANFYAVFGREASSITWPTVKPVLPDTLAATIKQAKAQNPEVMQQQALVKASREGVKLTKGSFMPNVKAVASWANNSNAYNSTDTNVTTFGVEASLPLFVGGANVASYKQSKFANLKAQDNLDQKVREIEATATSAYNNVLVNEQRVKALKVSLDSYEVTTDAVEKQEQAGEASIIDVLDARDDEFSASVSLQQAKQDLLLAKFDLLAAVGELTYDNLEVVFLGKKDRMSEIPDEELVN